MPRVKNQHFVPRSLLKQFTQDGNRIYIFDKLLKKSFSNSIKSIAAEDWFYELPTEMAKGNTQAVENTLSSLEGVYAGAIRELIDEVESTGMFTPGPIDRNQYIAHMILIQSCRTRLFRDTISAATRQLVDIAANFQEIRRRKLVEEGIELAPVHPPTPEPMTPFEHGKFMFDSRFIDWVMPIFLNHIWLVGDNRTSQPLFISDSPVAMRSHLQDSNTGAGFGSLSVEIQLPLSSRYVLILLERSFFEHGLKAKGIVEGAVLKLAPEEVTYYNGMQVDESHRQVYCREDRFDLVKEMIAKWPELSDMARPRMHFGD